MVSIKSCYNLTKSLLVLFNATAESVNCSLFLKNLEKHFCNLTYKKNFVKHIKNLPQNLSENFIGDNLSITDIAFIDYRYRPRFLEIIDYRYRFSTEKFIVPTTGYKLYVA